MGRPVTDVDAETDPVSLARKGRAFIDEVLAAWRRHLALLEDGEMTPATRHRIQLERVMSVNAKSATPA